MSILKMAVVYFILMVAYVGAIPSEGGDDVRRRPLRKAGDGGTQELLQFEVPQTGLATPPHPLKEKG